jgi:catechol 2,3-dioxygenase-like lactoylglutathione lyase family enzyme
VSIKRVVPDIACDALDESRAFFTEVLGFEVAMDMGWILTLVSPDVPAAQITLFPDGEGSSPSPDITVEVDDVDDAHEAVVRAGHEVVYTLTDEEWGVRRFFVKDPSGVIVNVMAHVGR